MTLKGVENCIESEQGDQWLIAEANPRETADPTAAKSTDRGINRLATRTGSHGRRASKVVTGFPGQGND